MSNVLSLFDGMGNGKLALNKLGIPVTSYYTSEIDKYAAGVSKFLHTDSVQLGDIRQWHKWELPKIDLLIGGSPCQGFSFAGKQKGMSTDCKIEITTLEQYQQLKKEGFEFNGQSYLFWEYVDILKTFKPTNFLLENVVMAKKWQDIITEVLEVEPIMINSSLVSAQNRKRLYWCNWDVEQPEDKGILLKDIIETKEIGVIKNRGKLQERNDKAMCIDASYHKGADNHGQRTQIVTTPGYSNLQHPVIPTFKEWFEDTKNYGASKKEYNELYNGASMVGRKINPDTGRRDDYNKNLTVKQYIEINENPDKSRCLSTVQKDTLLSNKKSGRHFPENLKYRKLTPIECERLQTVPDDSTRWGIINNKYVEISNSQRYKMLGNGWTVDVIANILQGLPILIKGLKGE